MQVPDEYTIPEQEDKPVFVARDWLDDDDDPNLLAASVCTDANYAYEERT